MANWKKLAQGAAGAAGAGGGLNVEDVFSTYVYHGTQTQVGGQTITNNIDLATEGGMVWFKARDVASSATITDTEMGAGNYLQTASTAAKSYSSAYMTSFNTDGFTLGAFNGYTNNDNDYVSWTFRKAPKFFDVVTWSGDQSGPRALSHNLDNNVGLIITKSTNQSDNWYCWLKGLNNGYHMLNKTTISSSYTGLWNNTAPTTTTFTIDDDLNKTGWDYVAYLFADNNSDGNFGPTGDQDIIKCGNYTGTGTSGSGENPINVGFEPQWVFITSTDEYEGRFIMDSMRGVVFANDDARIEVNDPVTEASNNAMVEFIADGFCPANTQKTNKSGKNYFYVAIRRGPMAPLEDPDDAFNVANHIGDVAGKLQPSGFVSDVALSTNPFSSNDNWISTRLQMGQTLRTNITNPIVNLPAYLQFDQQDGIFTDYFWGNTSSPKWWQFARREGFLDVAVYHGNGSTTWRNHNLGVVPEMMWIKAQNASEDWVVYHKNRSSASKILTLNTNGGEQTVLSPYDIPSTPTSTQFRVGTNSRVNGSGAYYINFLFASLDGISKVGTYSGSGSSQNIDCGFSNGSQFVVIKRLSSFGSWYVFDSLRGITTSTDSAFGLDTNSTQIFNVNIDIEPYSGGFAVDGSNNEFNASGSTYLFWAIAA